MKTTLKLLSLAMLLVLIVFSCEKESAVIVRLDDYIQLSTDKTVYQKTDTILLTLDNNSDFEINTGMRCKQWLEMSYQENKGNKWSESKLFQYMYLRCLTAIDTIQSKTTATYKLPCSFFNSANKFQLLVPCHVSGKDTTITVTSNQFLIDE